MTPLVPYVAAWSSERWDSIRPDPVVGGSPALFTSGKQGEGTPVFGRLNEPRQRRAMVLGLCGVCGRQLRRLRFSVGPCVPVRAWSHVTQPAVPYFGIPERRSGVALLDEPLVCRPCAELSVERCPRLRELARAGDLAFVRVIRFQHIMCSILPTAGPDRDGNEVPPHLNRDCIATVRIALLKVAPVAGYCDYKVDPARYLPNAGALVLADRPAA